MVFLRKSIGLGLTAAALASWLAYSLPRSVSGNIETIKWKEEVSALNAEARGWNELINETKDQSDVSDKVQNLYIQLSANNDPEIIRKNKADLMKLGYNNVFQVDIPSGGKRTIIGPYSSIDDVANAAPDFSPLVDQVGVVKSVKGGGYIWEAVISIRDSLEPDRKGNMPREFEIIVDQEIAIYNSGTRYKINPELFKKLMEVENAKYDPNEVSYKFARVKNNNPKTKNKKPYIFVYKTDKKGNKIPTAYGLTSISPIAIRDLGYSVNRVDVFDPRTNIRIGIEYLGKNLERFKGNVRNAVAAYNGGPTAVSKYGGVPPFPETQQYVASVLSNRRLYSQKR